MKNKTVFVGIDVSRNTFDAAQSHPVTGEKLHKQFNNKPSGFKALKKWIEQNNEQPKTAWLICMENTGVYSLPLCQYLQQEGLSFSMESGLKIQRSLGIIKREKSDKADAFDIARYARLHSDELQPYRLPPEKLQQLRTLLSFRQRLIKQKSGLQASCKEICQFSINQSKAYIKEESERTIQHLKTQISKVTREVEALLQSEEHLEQKAALVSSVIGVGPIITAWFMVKTNGFQDAKSARQFSSYCGSAPFGYSSGTSIKRKVQVSQQADKQMKSLLTNASYVAIRYDPQIRAYFKRKLEEGKNEFSVINAIRNKLIHRVFATVKRGTPFVPLSQHAA